MNKRQNPKKKPAHAASPGLNPHTHPDAAGIDIGSTEIVAALPPERRTETEPQLQTEADAFRLAAHSLSRAHDAMGQFCRRMKGRLGKAEGIVAVAHKLARIVYAMITTGQPYDENEAFKVTPSSLAKRLQHLKNQAAALGLQLTPI